MTAGRWQIPQSWQWVEMQEISEVVGGGTPNASDSSNFDSGGTPWLTPADLSGYQETYISKGSRNLSAKGMAACGAKLMPEGAVLFTSRAPIGYVAIAANPIATNQGFKSFVLATDCVPEFFRYYLKSSKAYAESMASGSTFLELSGGRAKELVAPLAPTNEQRRIVAKLDALVEKSRSIREKLDRLPRLFANLQKSILNSAFRGDLTKEWRANNPNAEPASELLKRIRAERRAKWEADLIAKGKDPKKAKYVEPEQVDAQGLPELPEGWCWASVDEITVESRTGLVRGTVEQNDQQRGHPYIRMQHYDERGEWHMTGITWVEANATEFEQFQLQPGDLLFNTRNSRELVGKVAVWPQGKPGYLYNNNLLNLRFVGLLHPGFVGWQMIAPFFLEKLERVKSATTSVAAIYQKDLLRQPIAVPPLAEQIEISTLVEKQIDSSRRLEELAEHSLQKCSQFEQSALAKAFRGELVPQDPNDEPASVLLERIRAQRTLVGEKRRRAARATESA